MRFLTDFNSLKERILRYKNDKKKLYFFDYDGTLAPFVKERDKAFIYPELIPFLKELINKDPEKIIFVSGRSLDSILPLLSCLDKIPQVWGSHGNERFLNGKTDIICEDASNRLDQINKIIRENGLLEHSETKVVSITLHKRELSKGTISKIETVIKHIRLNFPDLEIKTFDGGYEILIDHRNKGDAVMTVLKEFPDHLPIYFGDDLTDEDAFFKIKDFGISFLVREELRKTNAHIWIKPPHEIVKVFKEEICPIKED